MQKSSDNVVLLIVVATGGMFLMVASFLLLYIRNQNRLLQQRQQLQQKELSHQKELLHAIIESQEEERKRIGRDLHDDVGAAISSLRLIIEMFTPTHQDDSYHQFITASKSIIDTMMVEVRNISHNLSPVTLSYYGLSTAIGELTTNINHGGMLSVTFIDDAHEQFKLLPLQTSTDLYRVLEELLTNTIRHAQAKEAVITCKAVEQNICITYADNGIGMIQEQLRKGMGLYNIESRLSHINALYTIDTAPHKGFSITITLFDNQK